AATVCFIPGFRSDFTASKKADYLYDFTVQHQLGFLSWNHSQQGSVVDWYRDGLEVIKKHPVDYIVGASMGLWIAMLISLDVPVKGIIGTGGGVDITERWLQEQVPPECLSDCENEWRKPSFYDDSGYYDIRIDFLLNSRPALLLTKPQAAFKCPHIQLIHGVNDHDVPINTAHQLYKYLLKHGVERVSLMEVEDGDHRLSRSQDLALLGQTYRMWQEAKANDKRIRELMVDHRRRAERRRAYYESRLGDPQQLIRVIGSSTKLYPDAEQFYYHENTENLMPWQANTDIKIDRFDGRSLLDFVPEANVGANLLNLSREDREMADELNFERYHDLIEAELTESDRLAEVDEEWTKLLDRHQAKLALIKINKKSSGDSNKGNNLKGRTFGFDYGTTKVVAADDDIDEDD
ncbi:alternative splicing regulator-domain-containing protein, partial [Parasitella parasitica]